MKLVTHLPFVKLITSLIYLFLFSSNVISQNTPKLPKEIKVNWDTKLFEDSLPIDQQFILTVYSEQPIPNLVLMRYIARNTFYYYEQPISFLSNNENESISIMTKQSIKYVAKDGITTSEITSEYNGDPKKKIAYIKKYRVSPLRANFYYSLIDTIDYEAGKKTAGIDVSSHGLKKQKEKGAIANTYLSYQDNSKRKVTAIIGVSYLNTQTKAVRPYLGLRYNFIPINREFQSRYYEEMHYQGSTPKRVLNKFSLDVGITLASIEDSARNQYNLFGSSNLLTGLGYRLSDGFFISSGTVWYNRKEDITKINSKNKINAALYLSLSFDWDFSKSFDSFKKSLGAVL